MTRSNRRAPHAGCPLLAVPVTRTPERLVGIGFRCWMAGYQTGDIGCWEEAWNVYEATLGPAAARVAVSELGCWVRKIQRVSGRGIATFPAGCRSFCRDECVAISMVAASQHKVCPALRACAFALLGSAVIDDVMAETDSFALTLAALDQRLEAGSIALASTAFGEPQDGAVTAH